MNFKESIFKLLMMKSIKTKYILFILLIAIAGCRKDEKTEVPVVINPSGDPTIEVISGVTGLVTNENGDPVSDAKVTVYNQDVITDKNGVFYVNNVGLKRSSSMIKVESAGYFDGFKSFSPSLGGKSFVHLKMISQGQGNGFLSTEGGTITLNGGASISIPPNSLVIKDGGDPYEGEVVVQGHWYDPTDSEVGLAMPGNLLGLTKDGVEVQLGTYGMIAIELISTQQFSLQLAPNSAATLNLPVSEILDPNETVPLWSFDAIDGIWVEEGIAIFQEGFYRAEVSHLSFWNCADFFPLVNIEGKLTNQDFPITNIAVEISTTNLSTGFGFTDVDGVFRGKVPQGENLLLKVIHCGEVIVSEEIVAIEGDKDLGEFKVELASFIRLVEGRVVDCTNQPLENVYGVLRSGEDISQILTTRADGTFKTVIVGCQNDNYTLQLVGLDDFKTSEIIPVNQSPDVLNLGDVFICEDFEPFFEFRREGGADAIVITDNINVFYSNDENLIIRVNAPDLSIELDFAVEGLGQYNPYNVRIVETEDLGNKLVAGCGYSESELYPCDDFNIVIDRFDDFIVGTYSGFLGQNLDEDDYTNAEYEEYFYTGSFRLNIDQFINTGEVTGRIWFDENENNLRDPDENRETPIMEARLIKIDDYQYPILSPTLYIYNDTYRFRDVILGSYNVSISGKSGFIAVEKNAGSDDIDNDFVLGVNGAFESDEIIMEISNTINNVDLGLAVPDGIVCGPLTYEGCVPDITVSTVISAGLPPFQARVNGGPLVSVDNFVSFPLEQGGDVIIQVFDANDMECTSEGFVNDYNSNLVQGFVWLDSISGAQNLKDDDEIGVDEISVLLYNSDGIIEQQTLTKDGAYLFENVSPDNYYVQVQVPDTYDIVEQNVDLPNGSDIDTITGRSEVFLIEACDSFTEINAGIKLN